jgi:hypothetical protein
VSASFKTKLQEIWQILNNLTTAKADVKLSFGRYRKKRIKIQRKRTIKINIK